MKEPEVNPAPWLESTLKIASSTALALAGNQLAHFSVSPVSLTRELLATYLRERAATHLNPRVLLERIQLTNDQAFTKHLVRRRPSFNQTRHWTGSPPLFYFSYHTGVQEGIQYQPSQDVPLWHVNSFELKAIDNLLLLPSRF